MYGVSVVLLFLKLEYPEKNPRSRGEIYFETDTKSEHLQKVKLIGKYCSHARI